MSLRLTLQRSLSLASSTRLFGSASTIAKVPSEGPPGSLKSSSPLKNTRSLQPRRSLASSTRLFGTASTMAKVPYEGPPGGYLASRQLALPKETNMHNDIFGGWIMCQMDLASATAASRHSGEKVVTMAVDNLVFKKPVHVGDTLSCYTWIQSVGRTSMKVLVKVIATDLVMGTKGGPSSCLVTEGVFTMVAIDGKGGTVEVPGLDQA